ncbi:MAG: glycosyltransferase family 4 protein [Gammaproteobacteria bacterium]
MANQTRQLARLLGTEGISVEIVRTNADYRPAFVGKLRGVRAVFRLIPYLISLWSAIGRAELVHLMANSGWSWHLFAAPAVWMANLRNTPVLVNYRGGDAEAFFQRSYRWVAPTLEKAAAVVVPSSFLEAVFAKRRVATRIVPNVVDLSRFNAKERPTDRSAPHLIVTRNLEPIYDIPTALQAFQLVHAEDAGARLTVAGTGPERDALVRLADTLQIADAVTFCGRLDNEDIASLYTSADVMLNASTIDNMPISILEALASGVPVVSTRAGGIPHLVSDGETALLVPTGDSQAMAAAAKRLLNDAALSDRLRGSGLKLIRQYTWPSVRSLLFAAYQDSLTPSVDSPAARGQN